METSASFVSSRQGCESCEVKVLVPPIACSRADSMSDACEGNGLTQVLVKGQPYMRWQSGDEGCTRLAIVQIV